MSKLNDNDRKVYEYVKKCIQEGYPPSVREICAACGFKSTSTAQRAVNSLVYMGYLEKQDNLKRAVKLAGAKSIKVPVIIFVKGGSDICDMENIDGYVDFTPPDDNAPGKSLFALRLKAPVTEFSLKKGDIAIVEITDTCETGTLAAVISCGGEDDKEIILKVADEADPNKTTIIGRVISAIKYF